MKKLQIPTKFFISFALITKSSPFFFKQKQRRFEKKIGDPLELFFFIVLRSFEKIVDTTYRNHKHPPTTTTPHSQNKSPN